MIAAAGTKYVTASDNFESQRLGLNPSSTGIA